MVLPTETVPGDADVFSCAGQPDSEPTFHLERMYFDSRAAVVGGESAMCLRSTVPVQVVVERRGLVEAAPIEGGLQYQPLSTPEAVLTTDVDSFNAETSFTLPRSSSVPNSVSGATYSIAYADTSYSTLLSVHPCGSPATNWWGTQGGDGMTVDSISLFADQHACVSTVGRGSIEVSVLGTLDTTGSDPTRLPPDTTSRMATVPPPGFYQRAFAIVAQPGLQYVANCASEPNGRSERLSARQAASGIGGLSTLTSRESHDCMNRGSMRPRIDGYLEHAPSPEPKHAALHDHGPDAHRSQELHRDVGREGVRTTARVGHSEHPTCRVDECKQCWTGHGPTWPGEPVADLGTKFETISIEFVDGDVCSGIARPALHLAVVAL